MKYKNALEKIREKSDAAARISAELGIKEDKLADKLKGEETLYLDEADTICNCLGISCGSEKVNFFYNQYPKNGI